MFGYLLAAFLIIIIICLIYYVFSGSDTASRQKFDVEINKSAGTYDDHAKAALGALTRIANPTAGDYFNRGFTIRYNVLEGDTRLGIRNGILGAAAPNRRRRRRAVENIARDYTDALINIVINEDTPFMIYQMEDFGRNLNPNLNPNDYVADEDWAGVLAQFIDTVTVTAPVVKQEIIDNRLATAAATSNNHIETVNKYFTDATKYTDDRQNVHDSKVSADLRDTLKRIKTTVNSDKSIEEARAYITGQYAKEHPEKVVDALRGLDTAKRGELVSTFGETEANIFAYTWNRTKHPRNQENTALMQEAVANSLADGTERGTQVCVNGRCGRILTSLATLDYDRDVSTALTFEAYRNQIYQETKDIFNKAYQRASADPDLKPVAEQLDDPDKTAPETVVEKFKADVKNEIDINLDQYKGKFSPEELASVKNECYAVVDF